MKRCLLDPRLLLATAAAVAIGAVQLAGCSSGEPADADQGNKTAEMEKPTMPTIELTSTAVAEGQPIPTKFTGDGEDVSPPLGWTALPEGARELALICDDPDAPTKEPWVHWVIYHIPPETTGLPEGVPKDLQPGEPAGAMQGKNSWPDGQNVGYRGPAPPPGKPHRYFFKLYVLDTVLPAKPGLTKKELLDATSGHVIATGQLMGTYER